MSKDERRYYAALARVLPNNSTLVRDMSAWVDSIRSEPISAVFNGKVPRALTAFASQHSSRWHYENYPFSRSDQARSCRVKNKGQLEEAFMAVHKALRSDITQKQEAILIAFAVHLLEDAHQPLHVSTLIRPSCEIDRGGNTFCLQKYGNRCVMNLHRLWDGAFSPDKAFWQQAGKSDYTLLPINTELALIVSEGKEIVRQVYEQPENRAPVQSYVQKSKSIAELRLEKMVSRASAYLREHYKSRKGFN